MELPLSHHLPSKLISRGGLSLLPGLTVHGYDNSYTVKGHCFHFAPVIPNVLGVSDAPSVIDHFLSSRTLGQGMARKETWHREEDKNLRD